MSEPGDEDSPGEGEGAASPSTPLPKNVQEHLGRQLRSAYNAQAERPAYLGDPAVPPEFERLIRRMEVGERVHEVGIEAVRQALQVKDEGSE